MIKQKQNFREIAPPKTTRKYETKMILQWKKISSPKVCWNIIVSPNTFVLDCRIPTQHPAGLLSTILLLPSFPRSLPPFYPINRSMSTQWMPITIQNIPSTFTAIGRDRAPVFKRRNTWLTAQHTKGANVTSPTGFAKSSWRNYERSTHTAEDAVLKIMKGLRRCATMSAVRLLTFIWSSYLSKTFQRRF